MCVLEEAEYANALVKACSKANRSYASVLSRVC